MNAEIRFIPFLESDIKKKLNSQVSGSDSISGFNDFVVHVYKDPFKICNDQWVISFKHKGALRGTIQKKRSDIRCFKHLGSVENWMREMGVIKFSVELSPIINNYPLPTPPKPKPQVNLENFI